MVHQKEIKQVLERASIDNEFLASLLFNRSHVLDDYDLSSQEKAAILSGDVLWIESQTGPLDESQKSWFEHRLTAEIW